MQWAVQAAKGGIPVTKTWRYRIDMHSTALNTQVLHCIQRVYPALISKTLRRLSCTGVC